MLGVSSALLVFVNLFFLKDRYNPTKKIIQYKSVFMIQNTVLNERIHL